MRRVFTSARLENVEAVAELLRVAGIEVRISDGRSYRGTQRGTFSYSDREPSGPQPAVWILNADDQPRGRQLLRDAGLLESTRAGESNYLPLSTLDEAKDPATRKASNRTRWRLALVALIVIVSGLIYLSRRQPTTPDPTKPATTATPVPADPAAPKIIPQQVGELAAYRADVPTALAKLLVERQIAKDRPSQACILIDGGDPPPQFIESLAVAGATKLFAGSDCPGQAAWNVEVHDYMTDGSGRGTVQLESNGGVPRSVEAERDGTRWNVLPQP